MSKDQIQSAQVDTRGFTYALAPYMRKQEWQLELLENRLAQSQKALDAARMERDRLDEVFNEQLSHLQVQSHSRPNPQMHGRGIAYLADLRSRMASQDEEVAKLRAQRDELQAQLVAQTRAIDGLIEHRASALKEFVEEETRKQAAEADRDWIGRSLFRAPQQTQWEGGL